MGAQTQIDIPVIGNNCSRLTRPSARNWPARIGYAAIVCAGLCSAGHTSAACAQPDPSRRSVFHYVDEKAPEPRRYVAPKVDADPTDLSVEELRSRVFILEDKVERLEALIEAQTEQRRQMESQAARAPEFRPVSRP